MCGVSTLITDKYYMNIRNLLLVVFLFLVICIPAISQTPQKFKYQGICRDNLGVVLPNQAVNVRLSIHDLTATGAIAYQEMFSVITNQFGLITLDIGDGVVQQGVFLTVPWQTGDKFLEVEMDLGSGYISMGTTQLLSVPYALHSKTAESISGTITEIDPVFVASPANGIVNTDITNWNTVYGWGNHSTAGYLISEVDGSVTNEIQLLSISNDTIRLSNGGFVKLPAGFNGQYSSLTGAPTNVSAFSNDAGYLTSFTEIDGSVTNELQALSISNDTIRLSNGGFVKLPAGFNGQYSSLTGAPSNVSSFANDAGYLTSFTEVDGSVTNELQALSISNDTIYLSNGGFVKLLAGFNGQYSSLTGAPTNVSAFTNDAGYLTSFTETDPKIEANTSGYSPKWNGSAMVTGAIYQDASNNVGIGTTTPSTKLEVSGQVKITGGTPGAGKILTSDAGGLASWQAAPGDNLGNHTATQNINLNGFALVSGGTRGLKMDSRGNIGINMAPQNTSGNDVNLDILSPDGWGHANVNLRGYNWATNSYKCTRGSGCDFYSGAWWSDTYNEHLFFLCSDGAEFAKGITIRKNSNVGIGTQAPSTKLDVNGVITATGGNSTNWNTAYGWGNHNTVGYLTSFTEFDTMLWKKNINDIYFNNGNVGIGTTTPSALLHIKGGTGAGQSGKFKIDDIDPTGLSSIELTNNAGNTFYFYKLSSGYPANGRYTQGLSMIESSSANGLAISEVAGDIHFYTAGNNERITIKNTGNVGIGTNNPTAKLDVIGDLKVSGSIYSPGMVVQTIVKTSELPSSLNVTTYTEANTDYRVSFTPKFNNSIILIEYSFPINTAMASNTVFDMQLIRDIGGTEVLVGVGPVNGSRQQVSFVGRPGNGTDSNDRMNVSMIAKDSGLTSGTSYTYGFKYRRETGGSGICYFNSSNLDSNVYGFSGIMTMKITEIAQ